MRKINHFSFKSILLFLFLVVLLMPYSAFAILTLELTQGISGAVPIVIEPFKSSGGVGSPQPIGSIISSDLQNSGRFKVYSSRDSHVNYVITGYVKSLENNRFEVGFRLLDSFGQKHATATGSNMPDHAVFNEIYMVTTKDLRRAAHHISDLVFKHVTGIRGVFSTKIAYVVIQRNEQGKRYILEVADQDGYNPQPLLNSPEPIMSPSWSPNGKDIAYVSFENKRASIYIENIVTGSRYRFSGFPGHNGAPAWSKDGKKIALVLSKNGSPNIYIMDVATHNIRQITNDFYINTEPSWSPDGKSLVFTSNRSGGVQIYQVNLSTGKQSRVTFEGDYNARASYTWDGKHIAMIHRVHGIYNIALLDLDTGITRVLNSRAGDSASPSLAPNGTMILYDTVSAGRNVLGMVSADGRIQLVLPDRIGDAQDPAWSPFLG